MSQRWDDFKGYFAGEKLDGISYQIGSSDGLVVAAGSVQMALGHIGQPMSSVNESENYSLYLPIVNQD